MGPLTSSLHQQRVLEWVDTARTEGCQILLGGTVPDEAPAAGCYVAPTVVAAATGTRVTLEEVFGPFVTVGTFTTDDDALTQANATQYGLGAGLWTTDLARAHRFSDQLRAGMVWVNSYKRVNPGSPFGGVGGSGYGREMGFEAMHEYTEAQSIWINTERLPPWYPRDQA